MKRIAITIIASLAMPFSSQAQLGWTLQQCKAKYGQPNTVNANGEQTVFSFDRGKLLINIELTKAGIADSVSFLLFTDYPSEEHAPLEDIVDSDEVRSWKEYYADVVANSLRADNANSTQMSKEYKGIRWKYFPVLERTYVGYRHGKPVMELFYASDKNIQLLTIDAKVLSEELNENK